MTDWIPVFRTGTHTDSSGNEKTWTESDLDHIITNYHPGEHEAPAVIGHPEHDSPAWGWVEGLKRDGQMLFAKFKDLAPEFVDMLRKGLFRKRSISLYPDMTLRHVGFLGAMPPAVKGLPNVAFQDGEKQIIEFNFDCKQCNRCRDTERRVPTENNFCGSASVSLAGKESKRMKWFEWMKKKAADEGVTIEDAPSFSEPSRVTATVPSPADITAQVNAEVSKQVKAKELEFAEAQKTLDAEKARVKAEAEGLAKAKTEKVKSDIKDFCEGLCKEGKLTPAMMKHGIGMQNFLERIAQVETPIEFSDGDTKKTQTPFEFMKSFLSGFKKQIEFGEFAGADKDIGRGTASEKLSALTKQKMQANKELTYVQAFSEVQMENVELAREYAAEIKG